MKKLFTDNAICEILLTLYFSADKKDCLGAAAIKIIDAFFEIYKTEDVFDKTNNAELIEKIYANQSCDDRKALLKYLCFSETALYRFRTKVVERLKCFIALRSRQVFSTVQ